MNLHDRRVSKANTVIHTSVWGGGNANWNANFQCEGLIILFQKRE